MGRKQGSFRLKGTSKRRYRPPRRRSMCRRHRNIHSDYRLVFEAFKFMSDSGY